VLDSSIVDRRQRGRILMPATMSILVGTFPGDTKARAMSIYFGVGQAFAIAGPAIGGLCAQFIYWQWVSWSMFRSV
jgi:MFS family permease